MKPKSRRAETVEVRPAGDAHQVVSVRVMGERSKCYRRQPCSDCPWRQDAVGVFPAEAFRHSARTAYDMSEHTFACHQSGAEKPALCAGFLLRGADHNLSVRLARMRGEVGDDVSDGGLALHDDYIEMAVANGVEPDESVLASCRRRA